MDDDGELDRLLRSLESARQRIDQFLAEGALDASDPRLTAARLALQGSAPSRTEARLERTLDMLRVAGRMVRIGGWTVDLATRRATWSDEVCAIHECPPGYAPGVDEGIAFFAPECRGLIRERFEACAGRGVPYDEELQIITARGRRLWVRTIGEPVRDETGRIVRVQGAFQDISRARQAEEALADSERRFQQMADTLPLLVWSAEPDGVLDYANRAFHRLTGVVEGEYPPSLWLLLVDEADRERVREAWRSAVSSSGEYTAEFRLITAGGERRWHSFSAAPAFDEAGRVVKWFGTAVDIHDRVLAEDQALTLANQLQVTLNSISENFVALDSNWRYTYLNARAQSYLQRPTESLLGATIWEAFPEIVGTDVQRVLEQVMASREASTFEFDSVMADRRIEMSVFPAEDGGVALYFRDVTARRRLEEQLRQAQRLEAVGKLTGGIAHDFNNLLTVMLGNADMLIGGLEGQESLRAQAEMIRSSAERAAELTRHLLAFGRKQPLNPRPVDVDALMAAMDSMLRRTLGEQIDIQVVRGAGDRAALVDEAQLESAVLNLCINARDAMRAGGCLTIETGNAVIAVDDGAGETDLEPGEYVVVAISDTGSGMTPEVLQRAFDPFFTTKEVGYGSGLGLSMVYGFIRQSRGHVRIYSEPGEGTTVRLYLPRAPGQLALDLPQEPSQPASGNGEKILFVEDDDLVRAHMVGQLERLGYGVVTARNGPEGLELLKSGADFDLLFTDVVMPGGMSGRDLAEAARRLYPDLPILFTSGYAESAIVHQGRLDPGLELLSKPYRLQDLARTVRRVLDAARRQGAP